MRLFAALLLTLFACLSFASELPCQKKPSVFSRSGNIYMQTPNHAIQITSSGTDSSPVLSSNKKMVAFIRTGNKVIPEECEANVDTQYGNQIWIYNLSTKKDHLLVANNFQCKEPEKKIIDPADLLFSPDNKTLYFITSAWVTSGALHAVNIDNAKQRYITPANEFKVISKGENKGYLIVNQHRYFIGGGTYDWYWLMSPDGKEEGPLGPEITKDQITFIEHDA